MCMTSIHTSLAFTLLSSHSYLFMMLLTVDTRSEHQSSGLLCEPFRFIAKLFTTTLGFWQKANITRMIASSLGKLHIHKLSVV